MVQEAAVAEAVTTAVATVEAMTTALATVVDKPARHRLVRVEEEVEEGEGAEEEGEGAEEESTGEEEESTPCSQCKPCICTTRSKTENYWVFHTSCSSSAHSKTQKRAERCQTRTRAQAQVRLREVHSFCMRRVVVCV